MCWKTMKNFDKNYTHNGQSKEFLNNPWKGGKTFESLVNYRSQTDTVGISYFLDKAVNASYDIW